jgi:hypothetical protein
MLIFASEKFYHSIVCCMSEKISIAEKIRIFTGIFMAAA